MMGMGGGPGFGPGGDFGWFLAAAGVFFVGMAAMRHRFAAGCPIALRHKASRHAAGAGHVSQDPISMLKERYVRGELGTDEFKERLELLIASDQRQTARI